MQHACKPGPLLLVAALAVGLAHTQDAPQTDLTDPAAVAQAYLGACIEGDAKTALQLLHPDDPLRKMIGEITEALDREIEQSRLTWETMWTEYLFLPMRMALQQELVDSQEDANAAQVTFRRNWEIDQKIVLAKLDDGTWRVKVVDSITATSGGQESFLASQIAAREQRGPDGSSRPARIYDSQSRLRRLYDAIAEYAKEHDNRLPPADRWVDELEPYVLDRSLFKCPAAPDAEYGYAMNVLASEQEIPRDWNDRRNLLVLFEWPGAERNAAAMPDELAEADSFWDDGRIAYISADQNTGALSKGMAFADIRQAEELRDECSNHLRLLAKAARRYARENDGLLPGADTWQDDIALYLLEEGAGEEVFTCPCVPELQVAYAINKDIAGQSATELTDHGDIVLFFESDLNVPNAAGDPDRDAPGGGRHITQWDGRRTNQVAYLSGSTGDRNVEQAATVE